MNSVLFRTVLWLKYNSAALVRYVLPMLLTFHCMCTVQYVSLSLIDLGGIFIA